MRRGGDSDEGGRRERGEEGRREGEKGKRSERNARRGRKGGGLGRMMKPRAVLVSYTNLTLPTNREV